MRKLRKMRIIIDIIIFHDVFILSNQGVQFGPKTDCESDFFFESKSESEAKRMPSAKK